MVPHLWHMNYSVPYTKYFGLMGCRTTSKGMGIGEAERHWKQNKKIRQGQRARLSPEKTKKQATIAADFSLKRSQLRRQKANKAGLLWTDEDFDTLKLGEFFCFQLLSIFERIVIYISLFLEQVNIALAVLLIRRKPSQDK